MEAKLAEIKSQLKAERAKSAALQERLSCQEARQFPLTRCDLSDSEVVRYSRQLVFPAMGPAVQSRLRDAKVLVVGAGGLGCPVLMYISGAGVGNIGIVDGDDVDVSNLHRQVLYSLDNQGQSKAEAALQALRRRNPHVQAQAYPEVLCGANAEAIISQYDVVVDCTDNVVARYLINDACVLLNKSLVSGSALGLEGQVSVFNYKSGPCYRCVFPNPMPAQLADSCSDSGVLGPVPGLIGCMQAIQVLQIAGGMNADVLSNALLIFDGYSSRFRRVNLSGRKPDCRACGDSPSITSLTEHAAFVCGGVRPSLPACSSVSAKEYAQVLESGGRHLLLDVRIPTQFSICSLQNAVNVPLASLLHRLDDLLNFVSQASSQSAPNPKRRRLDQTTPQPPADAVPGAGGNRESGVACLQAEPMDVYVVCRRGVDSAFATQRLHALLETESTADRVDPDPNAGTALVDDAIRRRLRGALGRVMNVRGGYLAWRRDVQPTFMHY